MSLFSTTKDYSEMLSKIALCSFFSFLIALIILANNSSDVKKIIEALSLGYSLSKDGINLLVGYVILPGLFACIERSIKLHDRISDIFEIRKRFDINNILLPIAESLDIKIEDDSLKKIENKRKELMGVLFYRFASSTDPKIDKHYIIMALDNWCWYWIFLEFRLIFLVLVIALFLVKANINSIILVSAILLIACLVSGYISKTSKKYALDEIKEILKNEERKKSIKDTFENAI